MTSRRLVFAWYVRHPNRAEMRTTLAPAFGSSASPRWICDASERGAAGVETGLDVCPVVNGNLAGLVKGFAAGEFLSVPRWWHDATRLVVDRIHVVLDAKTPTLTSRGLAPLRQNLAVRCADIIPYFPKTCNRAFKRAA